MSHKSGGISHELLARRVAAELRPGQVVSLGAGLPATVASYAAAVRDVILHSENGVLGYGPTPEHGKQDADLVDAGGRPIGLLAGAAILHHADSFGMVRGGYVDVAVVEAFQVSERGDLVDRKASLFHAEYRTGSPENPETQDTMFDAQHNNPGGPAESAEIAARARRVIVMMDHTTRDGTPRIVRECSYPTAGRGCVNLIVTDVAVIQVTDEGLLLKEVAPGLERGGDAGDYRRQALPSPRPEGDGVLSNAGRGG